MSIVKIDNSKNKELIHIYTSDSGHKFFAHKNVLDISPARGVSAARADRFIGMKLSEANIDALLDSAIDGINKPEPDFVNAVAILHLMKYRQKMLCEENSLLDLSAIYYFLQDEDPLLPSSHHNQIKHNIWANDEKARGFFLLTALAITKRFSDTPEEDSLRFLENTREISERIYQFIPRP